MVLRYKVKETFLATVFSGTSVPNKKLVVLCGESIGNVVVTRKRCQVQVL